MKHGASGFGGLDVDRASVKIDDRAGQRRTKAEAAMAARPVGVLERVEDLFLVGRRDAAPGDVDVDP